MPRFPLRKRCAHGSTSGADSGREAGTKGPGRGEEVRSRGRTEQRAIWIDMDEQTKRVDSTAAGEGSKVATGEGSWAAWHLIRNPG